MINRSSIKSNLVSLLDFETITPSNKINTLSEASSLFIFALAASSYGVSNFHLKYIQYTFKEEYDVFSFGLWRAVSLTLIVYSIIRYKNLKIFDIRTLTDNGKFWLFIRTIGQFGSLIFFMLCLETLRVGTANCFVSMNPAAVLIISWLLLNEKFYWRYPIGIGICFLGVLMILSNEAGINVIDNTEETGADILAGTFWGISNLITIAMMTVSSKFLFKENLEQENQCFYIGITNFICSSILIVVNGRFNYRITFIFTAALNSIIFLAATFMTIKAVKYVDLNKTTPLSYFSLVVSTFLSIIFLGEAIYFTDIIGSFIILGYNVYNSIYPISNK